MSTQTNADAPSLEVLPAEGTLCATLLLDGEPIHDRAQPYAEVLALEEREPDVVAVFGVGLGYPVAGAAHLCPRARIVALEPVPGLAHACRHLLTEDWNLPPERFLVTGDLADFEAGLLDALGEAKSLAVVELPRLAARFPGLVRAFRAAIRDAVDAGTLGALPERQDPDFFGNLARATASLASTPPASSLSDRLSGAPAIVVDAPPREDLLEALRRLAPGALVWASLEAAAPLRAAGLPVDLLLVSGTGVPARAERDLAADSVLLLPPGVHPDWWEVPCRGRLLLGHTAASWLFPGGDVAEIVPLRWGGRLPLAITALHAGAGPLWVPPWEELPTGDDWNRLDPRARVRSALERMALGAGRALIELSPDAGPVRPARDPRRRLAAVLRELAPLGPARVHEAIRAARDGVRKLGIEARLHREDGLLPRLGGHLARRAAADPFARVFLAPGLRAVETPSPDGLDGLREGALGFLEWMERHLPAHPRPRVTVSAPTVPRSPVTVVLPVAPGDEIPARVLMWALDRRTDRRVRIRRLLQEAPARLGPLFDGLPREAWFLAAAALLEPGEHGIYLEPSVLLLDDVGELWDLAPGPAGVLLPGDGEPSVARIDREALPHDPQEILRARRDGRVTRDALRPGGDLGFGALPDAWCRRDRADLATSAVRLTCEDWLPWRSALHPLAWLWEFQFLAACEAGYVTPRELRSAVERGELRPDLAERARGLRAPLDLGAPVPPAPAARP